MKKKRPVSCEVLFVALLLLLAGCRAGLETGGSAGLLEVPLPSTETAFTEDNAIMENNLMPREVGKDYFEIWFSLRDGDAYPGNFTLTNAEGLVLQVRDGESFGTMGIGANDLYSAQRNSWLKCYPSYTSSFTLEIEEYAFDDNELDVDVHYWYYGTSPSILGSNIRRIELSGDELRLEGDNMQDYQVDVYNLYAEVSSYEELPILQVTGTDESEVWITGLEGKNQVEIHTEVSGYTVQLLVDETPQRVLLEQTFQPGQVAVVNYNPGEFSITLKEP